MVPPEPTLPPTTRTMSGYWSTMAKSVMHDDPAEFQDDTEFDDDTKTQHPDPDCVIVSVGPSKPLSIDPSPMLS